MPLLTALYVPAWSTRLLEEGMASGPNVVILDLEEAVAEDRKAAARDRAADVITRWSLPEVHLVVRINPLSSGIGIVDLEMVSTTRPPAVALTHVYSPDEVAHARAATTGSSSQVEVWSMVETGPAVNQIDRMAQAVVDTGGAIVVGVNDLCDALGHPAAPSAEPVKRARRSIAESARRNSVLAFDGAHLTTDVDEAFRSGYFESRELGFSGKTFLSAAQVADVGRFD